MLSLSLSLSLSLCPPPLGCILEGREVARCALTEREEALVGRRWVSEGLWVPPTVLTVMTVMTVLTQGLPPTVMPISCNSCVVLAPSCQLRLVLRGREKGRGSPRERQAETQTERERGGGEGARYYVSLALYSLSTMSGGGGGHGRPSRDGHSIPSRDDDRLETVTAYVSRDLSHTSLPLHFS